MSAMADAGVRPGGSTGTTGSGCRRRPASARGADRRARTAARSSRRRRALLAALLVGQPPRATGSASPAGCPAARRGPVRGRREERLLDRVLGGVEVAERRTTAPRTRGASSRSSSLGLLPSQLGVGRAHDLADLDGWRIGTPPGPGAAETWRRSRAPAAALSTSTIR